MLFPPRPAVYVVAVLSAACVVGEEEAAPEEFGETGYLLDPNTFLCSALVPYHRLSVDASDVLDSCVAQTPAGGALELPPGQYTIRRSWNVTKPIAIRTHGKTEAMPRCHFVDAPDCAELILRGSGPLTVNLLAAVSFDHIVVNANKYERLGNDIAARTPRPDLCGAMTVYSGVRVTNSVSKYAACGTSFGIDIDATDVVVVNNTFAFNGFHHFSWADGATVPNASDSQFTGNHFIDNTDIQLIFGGCRNCVIEGNSFQHTSSFTGGSFAELHLSAMVIQGGSYVGTDIANNRIDCGPYKRCGFGVYFGNEAWNTIDSLIEGHNLGFRLGGGSVHDNTIVNAQVGLNLGGTTSAVTVYNNRVASSGGGSSTSCGERATTGYNIVPAAILDRSRDLVPTSAYGTQDWVNCIPNWWSSPYGPSDPSEAAILAGYGVDKISIVCPTSIAAGGRLDCTAWGSHTIAGGYWTVNGMRVPGCDGSFSCAIASVPAGTYDVQAVAQTPRGAITSNVYRIASLPSQRTAVTVSCPSTVRAGSTLTCSATATAALSGGHWSVNGVRYWPCDNKFQCSATVAAGDYKIQVVAISGGAETRSNVVSVTAAP